MSLDPFESAGATRGTVVINRDGMARVLDRPKVGGRGWWLVGGGGLSNQSMILGDWKILTPDLVEKLWEGEVL